MNVSSIRKTGTTVYRTAKKAVKAAYNTVSDAFSNPYVRKNAKNAMPAALACMGGFSLMAFLNNKKKDGRQGALEKSSGTLAQIAFAVASFKHFFKNQGREKFGTIIENLKKFKFKDAFEVLKTNKSNVIVYAASIIGVKIATDITTKILDMGINKIFNKPRLGQQKKS